MVFKRDYHKFIVLKVADVEKYLNSSQRYQLDHIINVIESYRMEEGKTVNKYVVCNQDEPYAELIWKVIEIGEKMKKDNIRPTNITIIDWINLVEGTGGEEQG